jgi:AcrR family transcriptional regulator
MTPLDAPDDKREAILGAALTLFAERGFHGTAVPAIADLAAVGAGTIYRYFESKEAIVNALYQRWKGALAASLIDDFPFEAPARAQLDHFVSRAFGFARKHPLAFNFLELHHHAPYLDETSRSIESMVIEPARSFFEQHQRSKATRKLPAELLGAIVWGAIVGLVKAQGLGYVALTLQGEKQAADVIWDAIRKQEH